MQAFRDLAHGAAAIPWEFDFEAEEQRLLGPMIAEGPAARILARRLRAAMAAHHDQVLAQVMRGGVCPLDLHRLVPVPEAVLMLGPDDPASQRWLWEHWGTLLPLRHVRITTHADRRSRRTARASFDFFAADWTPWRALLQMRAAWPKLIFDLRPRHQDG